MTLHIGILSGGVAVFFSECTDINFHAPLHYFTFLSKYHHISKENNVCRLCFIKLTDTHFVPRCSLFHSFCVTVSESVEDPLVFPGSS